MQQRSVYTGGNEMEASLVTRATFTVSNLGAYGINGFSPIDASWHGNFALDFGGASIG